MEIIYTNTITEENVNSIRAAVGFRRIHPEQLQASLDGSAFIIAAYDQNRAKLKPGWGIQVDVRAWNHQEKIFESLGFQVSIPQQRGIPMHICLTNQIELTDAMFKQCGFSAKERNL